MLCVFQDTVLLNRQNTEHMLAVQSKEYVVIANKNVWVPGGLFRGVERRSTAFVCRFDRRIAYDNLDAIPLVQLQLIDAGCYRRLCILLHCLHGLQFLVVGFLPASNAESTGVLPWTPASSVEDV